MNKTQIEKYCLSTLGVVVVLAIVVLVNAIGSRASLRLDMTENKLFTLSEGTREILAGLDTPVEIRFYYTRDDRIMPAFLKTHVRHIRDLLREFQENSGGKITVRFLDPEPFSPAEDEAAQDRIPPRRSSNQVDQYYLGLAVTMLDTTVTIPFLDPSRDGHLEYDMIRAVTQVAATDRPVVGVMSTLPLFGQAANPMMPQMGGGRRAWMAIQQLQSDFEVREYGLTDAEIAPDVDVLLLIHPKDVAEETLYAIDQFLLKGGRVMALLDPLSLAEDVPGMPGMGSGATPSDLKPLLEAWGLEFSSGQTVADRTFSQRLSFQQGQPERDQPSFLFLRERGINQADILTVSIKTLWLPFAGHFSGEPLEGIEQTVLAHSSTNSQPVAPFLARHSGAQVLQDLVPGNKKLSLALRLSGTFPSAFPEGSPGQVTGEDIDAAEEGDGEGGEEDGHLAASEAPGAVILVGDTDLIFDPFCVQIANFQGQQIPLGTLNGNLALFQNMIEQLAGDDRLIEVRSRTTRRPFIRIQDMEDMAKEEHQKRMEELEATIERTQERINALQKDREDASNTWFLTPEQQAELQNLEDTLRRNEKDRRLVERELRKDIESLSNKLRVANIGGMAMIVTLIGIAAAVFKRLRTAAR